LYQEVKDRGASNVHAITIDYGQRHRKEIEAAYRVARSCGVARTLVPLGSLSCVLGGSALTSEIPVPEGHYADKSMRQTVVPNRNMILLSIAIACAMSRGASRVVYGAHKGDHAIYPDCRPVFVDAMRRAAEVAGYSPVRIEAPFVQLTKADIVRIGHELNVPFVDTWSCYNGREKHCGRCGTCVERKEAFALARVSDPTEYEA